MEGKTILITGGTGTLGKSLIKWLINHEQKPSEVRVLSRNEYFQFKLKQELAQVKNPNIKFILGDIRDSKRLQEICSSVEIIIHAAALKQIDTGINNPLEHIKTNILGTQNLINAARLNQIEKFILISTDKACAPSNSYGASKMLAEQLVLNAKNIDTNLETCFSVLRCGNFIDSTGSVFEVFREILKTKKPFPIHHPDSTRFLMNSKQVLDLIDEILNNNYDGEIIIPKCKSFKITDLAHCLDSNREKQILGLRSGEKINEVLYSENEGGYLSELDNYYTLNLNSTSTKKSTSLISNETSSLISKKDLLLYLNSSNATRQK